jgi:UDP-N-acetyl-D-mannosaminuronate dehydrogenase
MPSASRQINDGMPKYAVGKLAGVIGPLQDKVVAVLGLAFRGGVKEAAFSGVFAVVSELERLGAIALVHDPLYDDDEIAAFGFRPYTLGGDCDGVVVQADHAEYRGLAPDDFPGAGAVVDGRRVLDRGAFTGSSCRLQVIGGPGT